MVIPKRTTRNAPYPAKLSRGDRRTILRARRRERFTSIITNEIILSDLIGFLDGHFSFLPAGRLLDVGAGRKPYAPVYERYFSECTSMDVEYSLHDVRTVDVLGSADALPFPDSSFDCVLCTEVLEHCAEPLEVLREIRRVLVPGGRAFLTTPFIMPLHELPHDYFRYAPAALRHLASSAALEVTSLEPRGDYFAVLLSLALMPIGLTFHLASRWLRLPMYTPRNPLIYLLLVLPQRAYLAFWRWATRGPRGIRAIPHRLEHYTLGYVTTLLRPPDDIAPRL